MDLRRERRVTTKVQAKVDDINQKLAQKQEKIAKATKNKARRAQLENIPVDTGVPPPVATDSAFKPRGNSQHEPFQPSKVLVRRDQVVPPTELTSAPERNALRESQAGNIDPRPATQLQRKAAPRPVLEDDSRDTEALRKPPHKAANCKPQRKAAPHAVPEEDSEEELPRKPQPKAAPRPVAEEDSEEEETPHIPQHKAGPRPVSEDDSEEEEEAPRQPKRKSANRTLHDEDDQNEEEEAEQDQDVLEIPYGFGQGDYRGIDGYPNWTPPRFLGEDVDHDQDQQLQNGFKRGRTNSIEPENRRGRKAQRIGMSDGRPKAKDLEIEAKEVLESAIKYYRARVSALVPYPEPIQESIWAKEGWKEGCKINDVDIDHDPEILKLITARGSHLRGEIKTHSREAVRSEYGFVCTNNPALMAKQRQIVEKLKHDYTYTYLKPGLDNGQRAGFLRNKAIQHVANKVWFKTSKTTKGGCDAVAYQRLFKPLSDVSLALVLNGLVCAVDEWTTGTHVPIKFYAAEYQPVFVEQLDMLRDFDDTAPELKALRKIGDAIYKAGCVHANIEDPSENPVKVGLSDAAMKAAISEFQNGFDEDDA